MAAIEVRAMNDAATDPILFLYSFNLRYTQRLAADVPDGRLADQPVPGRLMNHAAFLLGHLAWASDNGLRFLGGEATLPAEWKDRFGTGATPLAERSSYPSKDELLRVLEAAHDRLSAAFSAATPDVFAQPAPERMRARFPTTRHLMTGLMTSHAASHNGQFSAWRRAMGFAAVF
jgi:hypothetical protein